jgi:hypothetical protein
VPLCHDLIYKKNKKKFMKKFWIRIKDSEYPMLVECNEDDLTKPGLVKLTRITKDGKMLSVMVRTELIVSANEYEEEEATEE